MSHQPAQQIKAWAIYMEHIPHIHSRNQDQDTRDFQVVQALRKKFKLGCTGCCTGVFWSQPNVGLQAAIRTPYWHEILVPDHAEGAISLRHCHVQLA